ncbi:copper resistance CopC family protein [Methylocystis sp. ATCC 49242]|uniref:copper resistance CopC family protein n=1 Tax=Methylocystis sp. ATCC 49242 TaxID=622637 RepID=UPI0001F87E38|nr:copper resistance CopC family protein [Methylocystis sp. ATCC 49242]
MTKFQHRYKNAFAGKRIAFFAGAILAAATTPDRATAYGNGLAPGEPERRQSTPARKIELSFPSRPPTPAQRPIILAHAIVVRTSPAQGGVADANIGKVDVWYDAGIRDAFTALAVVSASGERVDKRDAAIDGADPAHVSVSVNPLTAGKYTVRYRALSADGHLVSGAWEFEVRP